jgi:glutamate dehydrogenase
LQALRRAQQRLLMRVLHDAKPGSADPALLVSALIDKLKVSARASDAGGLALEHAVLDAWALSEAASAEGA